MLIRQTKFRSLYCRLMVGRPTPGTSKITSTTTGGFNTAVKLTATGQPAGVTVTFSPTSITGTGTSTRTLKVAASTVAGTYPITVKGTAGSTTETTTVSLVVSGGNLEDVHAGSG